ncbi:hypothetical protein EVAR_74364_1 [Eumeta japonica]|uniref:Uncharacterized protein n=1 Tax=Eumeta variegata TaxID=151549 RepID=A0A4C1SF83_EUMVA|nr:hypothetical protein EVAR_74364_1 [Eumeta japonica]
MPGRKVLHSLNVHAGMERSLLVPDNIFARTAPSPEPKGWRRSRGREWFAKNGKRIFHTGNKYISSPDQCGTPIYLSAGPAPARAVAGRTLHATSTSFVPAPGDLYLISTFPASPTPRARPVGPLCPPPPRTYRPSDSDKYFKYWIAPISQRGPRHPGGVSEISLVRELFRFPVAVVYQE